MRLAGIIRNQVLAHLQLDVQQPAAFAVLDDRVVGLVADDWNKNVITMGLASGFLEPLESTSIHLIQTALEKLINLFPDRSFRQADIDFFNRETALEYEQVRDLIIFHYHANGRGEKFWRMCRDLAIPDTLQAKIDLYRGYGRVFRRDDELFSQVSWTAAFEGQGVHAVAPDPLTLGMPIEQIDAVLRQQREMIRRGVEAMPSHADFVARIVAGQHRAAGAEG